MDKEKKLRMVFECAKQFLNDLIAQHEELNEIILSRHLQHDSKFDDMKDANRRLIESLTNRNMMTAVINFKEKESQLKPILCNYDAQKILDTYSTPIQLFNVFRKTFKIKNVRSKKNLWRQFSEGIISGSRFMASFRNKEECDRFIKTFSLNKYTKAALPMLLDREIKGLGLALACDVLKELGYRDYPKPDVHLIKIFSELKLSDSTDPYEVYKAIIEMAEVVHEDAYTVDKIFWLISSGRFYLVSIDIGRNRNRFIKYAKEKLLKS